MRAAAIWRAHVYILSVYILLSANVMKHGGEEMKRDKRRQWRRQWHQSGMWRQPQQWYDILYVHRKRNRHGSMAWQHRNGVTKISAAKNDGGSGENQ